MVVILAGKAHRDPHLTATATVSLPNPGAGYEWRRISGGQDRNWNTGEIVGNSLRLGTTAANINKNAIVLRRVQTGTTGEMVSVPAPPGALTVQ